MNTLDKLYSQLLTFGCISLREAIRLQDYEWAEAEIEMLHNIPTLLGETNAKRHQYFWFTERERYIEWANAPGQETARSRMRVYYEPLWLEMEPIVNELCKELVGART